MSTQNLKIVCELVIYLNLMWAFIVLACNFRKYPGGEKLAKNSKRDSARNGKSPNS